MNTKPAVGDALDTRHGAGGAVDLEYKPDGSVVLTLAPAEGDATRWVRAALDGVTARDVMLVFMPGRYVFHGDHAHERYLAITNHDNGLKRIAFPFDRFDNVRIEGRGSEFIFHGRVLPFLFSGCRSVVLRELTIDWDIPFYFQATVTAHDREAGWIDLAPFHGEFSWTVRNGRLRFPAIEDGSYRNIGETLAFDPVSRRVAHGAVDLYLEDEMVELLDGGHVRMHVRPKQYPEPGSVIVSKGRMGENRYAPAIHGIESSNIRIERVKLHHALGMGFLFERCDTIALSKCGAFVRNGSQRMVSLLADATHFCNCRGEVLVEDCRFQHMLDDGTNVHGTYVVVDEVLDEHRARVQLVHFQQLGFKFAEAGDEVWHIRPPDPGRAGSNRILAVEAMNERFSILTFEEPIRERLAFGDLLENKTWNPSFTMRGCTISDHRARGIVLKTPLPILIEHNQVSSMMSAVLLRGESWFWFESGAVNDVMIRENRFEHCAYSGTDHAILRISPRLGKQFDASLAFDRNVTFENNQICTFGNRIVWADRVDGLRITGNIIEQTNDAVPLDEGAPLIQLERCSRIEIQRNVYRGTNDRSLSCDEASGASLMLGSNTGFS